VLAPPRPSPTSSSIRRWAHGEDRFWNVESWALEARGSSKTRSHNAGGKMTKSGLIEEVAQRTPHISKKDTEVVVNTIFDSMIEALKQGDRIEIRGFGSFQVKIREAREGRNPKTGEPVHISAKRTPFFKVGKELKEMVDQSCSPTESAAQDQVQSAEGQAAV
jgi:integration host factor subunit beta